MEHKQAQAKKPPLSFYIAAGAATIAALFGMTFYIMDGLERGVFAWWAYGPLVAFMLALLAGEHMLFARRR